MATPQKIDDFDDDYIVEFETKETSKKTSKEIETKLEPFSVLVQRKKREVTLREYPWGELLVKYNPLPQLIRQDQYLVEHQKFDRDTRSLLFPLPRILSSQIFLTNEFLSQLESLIAKWQTERQLYVTSLSYLFVKSKKDRDALSPSLKLRVEKYCQAYNLTSKHFLIVQITLDFSKSKEWEKCKIENVQRDYSKNISLV